MSKPIYMVEIERYNGTMYDDDAKHYPFFSMSLSKAQRWVEENYNKSFNICYRDKCGYTIYEINLNQDYSQAPLEKQCRFWVWVQVTMKYIWRCSTDTDHFLPLRGY